MLANLTAFASKEQLTIGPKQKTGGSVVRTQHIEGKMVDQIKIHKSIVFRTLCVLTKVRKRDRR